MARSWLYDDDDDGWWLWLFVRTLANYSYITLRSRSRGNPSPIPEDEQPIIWPTNDLSPRNHQTCPPFNWTINIMKISARRNNSAKIWLHDDRRIKLPDWCPSVEVAVFDLFIIKELPPKGSTNRLKDWPGLWAGPPTAGVRESFSLESLREHKKEVLWPLIARFCVLSVSGQW